MTKSPITWVKTFGFTMALGSPFSFLLLLLSKLLLGDEAALHVVPFVTMPPPLTLLPVPPMQLSLASAADVVDVVNVVLVDVVNDDIFSSFTAVVDGVLVAVGVVVVLAVAAVSEFDFKSLCDASSPDGVKK